MGQHENIARQSIPGQKKNGLVTVAVVKSKKHSIYAVTGDRDVTTFVQESSKLKDLQVVAWVSRHFRTFKLQNNSDADNDLSWLLPINESVLSEVGLVISY